MSKPVLRDSSVPYSPLPSNPNQQNVIVLPVYYHRPNQNYRYLRGCLTCTGILLLLSVAVFFLYPSDPTLQLVRIQLNHVSVKTSPKLTLDVSFSLTIRVRNRDFFSLDYDKLDVSVGYRGRELGVVSSDGGTVRARGTSYVNATLDLNAFEVVHDVIYLIADLAKGVIPFDTTTKIDGSLGVLFFQIPLKIGLNIAFD
ncbi:Late embryogenesis abundant protein, LEA-14 [Corchorus olitorius]|uniref:Late embryogenesis abundant protein, LEA-14 n=1 Tax=Corchorus olitorius TaxID=93759 RepID=A0A1R3GIX6_9ROSI|nr:Late embryogenesis abundant protein, LEA-14 [Corchorus olitorius]